MSAALRNVMAAPVTDGWLDDPLPLSVELVPGEAYPMSALGSILGDFGGAILESTQAPDGIVGNSLLAAASLACQAHADVVLPFGAVVPTSLFLVSVAESGERKSAVDSLVLRPHGLFEKARMDDYADQMAVFNALSRKDQEGVTPPRSAVFRASDPTVEGLVKLLADGLPSLGVFSAEGGRFLGGHGMSDETSLRTAAGLSLLWDGSPIDRVRAADGASKLFGRRLALHLMAQPQATFAWLSNPVLRDQGLFSRCLVSYPESTAGTRLYRDHRADETQAFTQYVERLSDLLERPWPVNERHELEPRKLTITGGARRSWIEVHDQIERELVKTLSPVRGLGSKAAEHCARIAGVLTLVDDPEAATISEEHMQRAAVLTEFYLGEALRLSGVQPAHANADLASVLFGWLKARGQRHVSLPEIVRFGPNKLRKASLARSTMSVLAEHYLVRPVPDGLVAFEGKPRREAWEVRQ